MVDKLKSAGDQLRAAWDNYLEVYSSLGKYCVQTKFPSEICHQLDTELDFISSYEPRIWQIKVAISSVRNSSSGLASINSLPPEILTRICLIVLARPCDFATEYVGAGGYDNQQYSTNPDIFAQVCAYRKVAISSCSLWHHIDLSSHAPSYNGLVSRAWTYAARSGDLPLELHIAERGDDDSERSGTGYRNLYQLVSHISRRVETFELLVGGYFRDFHGSIIQNMVQNEGLTLKKFVLRTTYHHHNSFVLTGPSPANMYSGQPSTAFRVGFIEKELEAAFASLTVLHVRGVFPVWSSKAYLGLVDLRLMSTDNWSHIKRDELIAILKSSLGLRILHFSLEVHYTTTSDPREVVPVHLQDLEVVRIVLRHGHGTTPCPSDVLQLLAPGSKPLRLSFSGHYNLVSVKLAEIERFFSRSRVAMFHTRVNDVSPFISAYFHNAPHLERVILDDLKSDPRVGLVPAWQQKDELGSPLYLRALHITRSELYETDLRPLVNFCPNNTVFASCQIYRVNMDEKVELSSKEVLEAFPAVKIVEHCINSSKDPTDDWDRLD